MELMFLFCLELTSVGNVREVECLFQPNRLTSPPCEFSMDVKKWVVPYESCSVRRVALNHIWIQISTFISRYSILFLDISSFFKFQNFIDPVMSRGSIVGKYPIPMTNIVLPLQSTTSKNIANFREIKFPFPLKNIWQIKFLNYRSFYKFCIFVNLCSRWYDMINASDFSISIKMQTEPSTKLCPFTIFVSQDRCSKKNSRRRKSRGSSFTKGPGCKEPL